ncbi:DUF423 domain-containing protein [Devosia sp. XJ19-1]|uniref:DUF423 domain-containing protein n=2 Tax=Devosia ureilytica TaxID=2952754 RepID=A0A9Q4AP81_9HYPH|nr:DUF423 domain-containing protein [Devosia ureilytica]MCP8883608.1 DUF423 domain-containing protein [Devosia ureilytica]MCP8887216.1 DUF423 domain-containing protein [Devosia ureilytica]
MLSRTLMIFAGLLGAAGVAAAAGASHGESRNLSAIATIFLAHAPALLALAMLGKGRVLSVASLVLALGAMVFGGDLALREWAGHGLFPGAAPLGGGAMILGWLGVAIAGVAGKSRP